MIKLDIYCYSNQTHEGIPLFEWLLVTARENHFAGGTAFRSVSGFGHHGKLHEERFFELGSDVPIMVSFIVDEEKCRNLLAELKKQNFSLFITKSEITVESLDLQKR